MEDLPFIVRLELTTKSPPCEGGERGVVISSNYQFPSHEATKGTKVVFFRKYLLEISEKPCEFVVEDTPSLHNFICFVEMFTEFL